MNENKLILATVISFSITIILAILFSVVSSPAGAIFTLVAAMTLLPIKLFLFTYVLIKLLRI